MATDHFKAQLEAILKVQMEGPGNAGPDPNRKPGKPFVARKNAPMMFFPPPPPPPGAGKIPGGVAAIGGVPAVGGGGPATPANENWNYFIALKIDSLLPLGQLLENIEGLKKNLEKGWCKELQILMICTFPSSFCEKMLQIRLTSHLLPWIIYLSYVRQRCNSADVIARNVVEFGGILPSKTAVTMALFSESLDSLVSHLASHLGKTQGLTVQRPERASSLTQSGLFTLDVLNILQPEHYKRPSQRARFGKYEWCKLHVVNIRDNSVAATIDIEVAGDDAI